MNNEKRLLTTEDAAMILGLGKSTLEQDRVRGIMKIPFVKIGRMVRYRKEDLDKYIESLKMYTNTSEYWQKIISKGFNILSKC